MRQRAISSAPRKSNPLRADKIRTRIARVKECTRAVPSRESREARIRKRPERQRNAGSKEAPLGGEVRARNSRAYRCQALAFPADMTGRRLLKNQTLFRVVRSRRGQWHREDFRVGANIRIIPTGAAIAQWLQFTRFFPSRTLSYTCALDGVRATARHSSAKGRGRTAFDLVEGRRFSNSRPTRSSRPGMCPLPQSSLARCQI